jgi:hypothetical protein
MHLRSLSGSFWNRWNDASSLTGRANVLFRNSKSVEESETRLPLDLPAAGASCSNHGGREVERVAMAEGKLNACVQSILVGANSKLVIKLSVSNWLVFYSGALARPEIHTR